MAVAARGCPQRSGRSRPGRGPSAAHRELGKHPLTSSDGPMLQVGGRMHEPLLTVDGRYRPMLRARWGHGWSGSTSRGRGSDGHQLGRRVRFVQGDHLSRWQHPKGARQSLSAVFACSWAAPWKQLLQPHGILGSPSRRAGSARSHAVAWRPIRTRRVGRRFHSARCG
jgi:hypothetical protein